MYQALYRKYRPASFDAVYGQEHITSVLKFEAQNDRISHAYLFCGSRGTGKTTCAKILAKSINCLDPQNGNPCGKCKNCMAIDRGTATDVVEMDAASNNGVDYIRYIKDEVVYTPSMLRKKVYIIDEVHMLSESAFNALLKTLEEPPEYVVFILATTELHKLPATIISRCQRFDFRRISIKNLCDCILDIAAKEQKSLTPDGARMIAKMAQGGMRDAISLMELCCGSDNSKIVDAEAVTEILGISSYESVVSVADAVADKNYKQIFESVADVVYSSKDIIVFWQDLISIYRDMIVVKSIPDFESYLELTQSQTELIVKTAKKFKMATLVYHSKLLDEALYEMQKLPSSKRVHAEMTLIRMCDEKLSASAEALNARVTELEDKLALMSYTEPQIKNNNSADADNLPEQPEIDSADEQPDYLQSDDSAENAGFKIESEKNDETDNKKTESESPRYQRISCWKEVAEKAGKSDALLRTYLSESAAYLDSSCSELIINATSPFAVTIIQRDNAPELIRDAMKICGCPINPDTAIKVTSGENSAYEKESAADELFSDTDNF